MSAALRASGLPSPLTGLLANTPVTARPHSSRTPKATSSNQPYVRAPDDFTAMSTPSAPMTMWMMLCNGLTANTQSVLPVDPAKSPNPVTIRPMIPTAR